MFNNVAQASRQRHWSGVPPNIGSRRRWRDTSDGLRLGEWQRFWLTAPARLNLALEQACHPGGFLVGLPLFCQKRGRFCSNKLVRLLGNGGEVEGKRPSTFLLFCRGVGFGGKRPFTLRSILGRYAPGRGFGEAAQSLGRLTGQVVR